MTSINIIDWISILRIISLSIIVIFHTYGYMCAEAHFPATKAIYQDNYYTLIHALVNIGMPMFTFISGYLLSYLHSLGKYRKFKSFVISKTKRLLIPYFCFGIIMMATTGNFHPFELFKGSYWHLWYLPVLFWLMIVGWFSLTLNKKNRVICFIIFSLLSLSRFNFPRILGLIGIPLWMIWFMLGIIINDNSNSIRLLFKKYHLHILFIIIYLGITIIHPTEYGESNIYFMVSIICIISSIWYLSSSIEWKTNKYIQLLDKYSFGIYIFHNWIGLYCISNTAKDLLNLESFAANHILIFPLLLSVIILILSTISTHILLKTRIGKFLLG